MSSEDAIYRLEFHSPPSGMALSETTSTIVLAAMSTLAFSPKDRAYHDARTEKHPDLVR